MPELPEDQARVLGALYEWRFVGHPGFISRSEIILRHRMEKVPDYILAAGLDGSGVDARACLDLLEAKSLIRCVGHGDESGKWTLPGGRVLRVTFGQPDVDPTLCFTANVHLQDPEGPWRTFVSMAGREPCGRLFDLTVAGIEAVEERVNSPAARLGAGAAHIRTIEKDPDALAAIRQAQARLRESAESMRDSGSRRGHECARREQGQEWEALADAIQESLRAAQQDLGDLKYQPPKTREDWADLACMVELPFETIRAGNITAREVYLMALAWVDRLRARTRLASGGNSSSQKPTHSRDFTSVDWFGTRHSFTKGNQAESVRALWEAWSDGGHSLSQETIGESIGSNASRFVLAKLFRRKKPGGGYDPHPAWGTMIQQDSKGCYRLAPPESA